MFYGETPRDSPCAAGEKVLRLLLHRHGLRAGGVTSGAARPREGPAPTALSGRARRSLKEVEEMLLKRRET